MNFKDWFKGYRRSYDLRCGMTELHMETAWNEGQKSLREFRDLIASDYARIGIWPFSGEALEKMNSLVKTP